jgi:branched-chain amino acid transport system substrate-binding protein
MSRCRGTSARRWGAALAASVLAIGLAACGGDDSSGGSSSNSSASSGGGTSLACKDGAITVGFAKAQSGVASFFDIAGTRGTKIAIDDINAKGGIKGCKIKIIEGDTKSDPAVAAQVARSLISRGAQILFVPDDFDQGIAAARVGQRAGVLTLSMAASSTQFGKAVGDKFFNTGPTTTQLAQGQAQYAKDKGWNSTFMVLDPGLAYFTEQNDVYTKETAANGGKVVATDKVDSLGGQADYSATISKIKATKPAPDVINAQMVFPQIGTLVKQLRAAGVDTPVIGPPTLQTRELPKQLGADRSNDIYYATQVYFEGAGEDPQTDPGIDKFATAYEAKFGHFPEQVNGPEAYQALLAFNQVLQRKDVTDAGSAADGIRALKNVTVPGGTLVRMEDGHAIWNMTIAGLVDGKFKKIQVVAAPEA